MKQSIHSIHRQPVWCICFVAAVARIGTSTVFLTLPLYEALCICAWGKVYRFCSLSLLKNKRLNYLNWGSDKTPLNWCIHRHVVTMIDNFKFIFYHLKKDNIIRTKIIFLTIDFYFLNFIDWNSNVQLSNCVKVLGQILKNHLILMDISITFRLQQLFCNQHFHNTTIIFWKYKFCTHWMTRKTDETSTTKTKSKTYILCLLLK